MISRHNECQSRCHARVLSSRPDMLARRRKLKAAVWSCVTEMCILISRRGVEAGAKSEIEKSFASGQPARQPRFSARAGLFMRILHLFCQPFPFFPREKISQMSRERVVI